MKNILVNLIVMLFVTSLGIAKGTHPGLSLNSQDVPVFYENSPLNGMKAFTLITSLPLKGSEIQIKLEQLIEKTLETLGQVVHLKDTDMRGFGAGNVLLIQLADVKGWDGVELPISRFSLSIESPVTLDKTGIKTFPMVWSVNSFLQGSMINCSEEDLYKAIQKLLEDFIMNYQYVNQALETKPLFYTY